MGSQNHLNNPYMPIQQPSTNNNFNNHSPSFSVNSLKLRNRQQYGMANKLMSDQARMQQYLNDSNDLITSSCSIQPASTTTSNTITANNQIPVDHIDLKQPDECDWDKLEEAAKVIANVQHAFEISDNEMNDFNDDDQNYHQLNHRIGNNNVGSRHLINNQRSGYGVNFNQNGHSNNTVSVIIEHLFYYFFLEYFIYFKFKISLNNSNLLRIMLHKK